MICHSNDQVTSGLGLAIDKQRVLAGSTLDVPTRVADLLDLFPGEAVLALDMLEDMWINVD